MQKTCLKTSKKRNKLNDAILKKLIAACIVLFSIPKLRGSSLQHITKPFRNLIGFHKKISTKKKVKLDIYGYCHIFQTLILNKYLI